MLLTSAAILHLAQISARSSDPYTFQTKPDIHGDQVVFTAEGDLWLGNVKSGEARRLTSDSRQEISPRFSPDGTKIAFVAQYDGAQEIYVMPTGGGTPTRLTFGSLTQSLMVCGWTPDGSSILCRSFAQNGLYMSEFQLVPATGGLVQRYPVPRGEFGAFSQDGQLAYVPTSNEWMNWYQYKGGSADDIWLYNPTAKSFKQLTKWEGVDTTPVWAGGLIYFVSEKSGSLNLWSVDPKNGNQVQITKYANKKVRYPGSDGHQIVFQVDSGLAKYDPSTGKVEDLNFAMNSDHIHERPMRVPVAPIVTTPSLGPTGKRVVMEARGQIISAPVEEGDIRILAKPAGARCQIPSWSPDAKKIAYISDATGENEVWTMDSDTGANQKQLTTGLQSNPLLLKWSPNSKYIGLQDRAGQTLIIDSTTGGITKVSAADAVTSYDGTSPQMAFSPDSRLLAFQQLSAFFISSVSLYDVETKKLTLVHPPTYEAMGPSFSPDGKFLAYIGSTTLVPMWSEFNGQVALDNVATVYIVPLTADAQSPFVIKKVEEADGAGAPPATPTPNPTATTKLEYQLDNLSEKGFRPPMPAGRYIQSEWVQGRLLLLSKAQPMMTHDPMTGSVVAFDFGTKALSPIGPADSLMISADRSTALIVSGPKISTLTTAAGGAQKLLDLGATTITVNPRDEWKQIFEESWRVARDFFYDENMHGVDWNAIHSEYKGKLALVGSRDDLTNLIKQLISELRCGHSYITRMPAGDDSTSIPVGLLGIDVEPATMGVKITKLYMGDNYGGSPISPLSQPGQKANVGDYILAIGGQPVLPNQDYRALLVGTVGQITQLTVNSKPSLDGARSIFVKPHPMPIDIQLRYQDWVNSRVEYVKKNAGPEFGYVHIPDMTEAGYIAFAKAQGTVANRDAVVYDFRSNGGGNLSSTMLNTIGSKPAFYFHPRGSKVNWARESLAPHGPIAALCDQDAFSDGEFVIETWKRLGLGPVVGKRTGGGEVGSGGGYALLDGQKIFIPNYGAFDPSTNKWIIEGSGATPDYDVDQDPAAVMAGRDPQLDKAIELLKLQLAKNPRKKIVTPPSKNVIHP